MYRKPRKCIRAMGRANPALGVFMQDQCNFFELSLNPNLYDPRLAGLAENAKAVLALHPPVVVEDCVQLRVSCRIHDGFRGRALSVPLADERVDGLVDRRAADGRPRSTALSHQA